MAASWLDPYEPEPDRRPALLDHPVTPPPPSPEPEPDTRPRLRVVSYNLRVNVDPPPDDWPSRSKAVVASILADGQVPDVVCTQESSGLAMASLRQLLPMGFLAVGTQRSPGSDEATHILVNALEWHVKSAATYVFGEAGPTVCGTDGCTAGTAFGDLADAHPRIFTHAELTRYPGLTLHVVSLQLSAEEELQHRELEQLAEHVRKHVPLDAALIVAGDFNAGGYSPTSDHTPVDRFLDATQTADALDRADVPTFGDWTQVDPRTHRRDYVLFRGLERLHADVRSVRTSHGRRASDHEPVLATFAFQA